MAVVFAVITVVRMVQFAIDGEITDLLWGLVAAGISVGFAWLLTRMGRKGGWRGLLPLAALPLVLMVGANDTALAACSTPGTHWHWRSSTDKFESKKQWTNCFSNASGTDGTCTSWYNARNHVYYCSQDIGGYCYWKYTGTISRHHSHKCSW